MEALQVCDGNVGLALEYLLAECFSLNNVCDTEITEDEMTQIHERRTDEMMALQAIYEEKFTERIPNHVWILKCSLPYLDKITQPKNDRKHQTTQTTENANEKGICRFYLKGFCKFGRRCYLKHSLPVQGKSAVTDIAIDGGVVDLEYEVEIRFPSYNKYPIEVPFLAFTSTSSLLDKHVCLNITKHMMEEAKKLAESEEPSVFTVVSLLDDETFLDSVLNEPPDEFSCLTHNKAWMPQQTRQEHLSGIDTSNHSRSTLIEKEAGTDTDANLAKAVGSMMRMNEGGHKQEGKERMAVEDKPIEVKRSMSRDEVRRQNPAEILKTNKKVIEDFKRKKVCSLFIERIFFGIMV